MGTIQVVIIDDHPMVREGLRQFLESCQDITVVGMAPSADRGLMLIKDIHPDVAIVDLNLPCSSPDTLVPGIYSYGIRLISELHQRFPDVAVLALTGLPTRLHKEAAIKAGAQAFLSKQCDSSEIAEAVRRLSQGKTLHEPEPYTRMDSLTTRELEILHLISQGLTDQQIAGQLGVSPQTVNSHLKNVYGKLGVSRRIEAALMAFNQADTALGSNRYFV